MQKCSVHSILGMKYELNFKYVYLYYLLLLCFSEFPQDLFVLYASILLYQLKTLIYTFQLSQKKTPEYYMNVCTIYAA